MVAVFGFFDLVECQLKYSKRLCLFNLMVVLHLHESVGCYSIHVMLHWNKVFFNQFDLFAVFIISRVSPMSQQFANTAVWFNMVMDK